jgi:GT2 family glycosyltransferase
MYISAIILTWNSELHIARCLLSLIDTLSHDHTPYEIFLIDNGSTDGTIEIVERFKKKYPKNIKVILLSHNTGTTYSRNLALKQAKGRYVALIDSDVEVFHGTIKKLLEVLEQDDQNGIVSPKLLYANGNPQKSTDSFPTVFSKIKRFFFLKHIEKTENFRREHNTQLVDYAISAFWLIKHEIIAEVGKFDENIFFAPEDVDYCLRVWKKGYRVIYVPEVSSLHHAQEISRGFSINRPTIEHIRGLIYFFRKHNYWFKKPVFILERN